MLPAPRRSRIRAEFSISVVSAVSRWLKQSSSFGRKIEKPSLENIKDPDWLLRHSKEATPGAALVDLFERYAEEQLFEPTIIYDFPVEVSPLSKNKPDDPAFVERFEIYVAGMEIGNAFTELNDPQEQRRRFELQLARKAERRPRSSCNGRRLYSRTQLRHASSGR